MAKIMKMVKYGKNNQNSQKCKKITKMVVKGQNGQKLLKCLKW